MGNCIAEPKKPLPRTTKPKDLPPKNQHVSDPKKTKMQTATT